MAELPQPPRRINLDAFYGSYLPTLWRALQQAVGDTKTLQVVQAAWAAAPLVIEINVAPGAVHTLTFAGDAPVVTASSHPAALLHVACDGDTWRMAVNDWLPRALKALEARLPMLRAALAQRAPADPQRLARLRGVPGCIRIVYTDDAGDVAELTLTLGDGNGPQSTVHLSDADVQSLMSGPVTPQQLLRGKIRLEGDTAYLVQVFQIAATA